MLQENDIPVIFKFNDSILIVENNPSTGTPPTGDEIVGAYLARFGSSVHLRKTYRNEKATPYGHSTKHHAESMSDLTIEAASVDQSVSRSRLPEVGKRMLSSTKACFTAIGQITLCENPVTGVLFTVGIALTSPAVALAGLAGTIMGNVTARILGYDLREINAGLYGFNAALVGMATCVKFEMGAASAGLLVVGAALSTVLMRTMKNAGVAPYTAPFIASTWLTCLTGSQIGIAPSAVTAASSLPTLPDLFGALNGIGQIMFQQSAAVGLIFLAGIATYSKRAAAIALASSLSAGAVAWVASIPVTTIEAGLLGYNAALCSIALKDSRYAFPAALASLPIWYGFTHLGVPALTAPFVLSSWLFSALRERTTA